MFQLFYLLVTKAKSFFIQKRPGKNEHIFSLIKFKTMSDKNDEASELIPDETIITKFGSLMRKFSLDELLQFINVLKGNMP